jgi:DNA-directed RNA polymerase subunit RPC12/RpoP
MRRNIDWQGDVVSYREVISQLLEEQEGQCAICSKLFGPKEKPQLDHDHETLEDRGLLCKYCNTRLAFYEEYKDEIKAYLGEE